MKKVKFIRKKSAEKQKKKEQKNHFVAETFKVTGMKLSEDEAVIERAIKQSSGINYVNADYVTEKFTVIYDAAKVSREGLLKNVQAKGYKILAMAAKNCKKTVLTVKKDFSYNVVAAVGTKNNPNIKQYSYCQKIDGGCDCISVCWEPGQKVPMIGCLTSDNFIIEKDHALFNSGVPLKGKKLILAEKHIICGCYCGGNDACFGMKDSGCGRGSYNTYGGIKPNNK